MDLHLERNLVFFDIESTGLNVIRDRIIQLAMIRYHKDGSAPVEKSYLINPGIPISAEAMAVHGITPEDVADKPSFGMLANEIFEFIGDADLAGYNSNRFDIPVLMEEFARVDIDFDVDNRRTIDVQRIFYKMEPRTLSAAYQFYCQKTMENAHDALEDVRATVEVLEGQLRKYEGMDFVPEEGEIIPSPIQRDVQVLDLFTNDQQMVDATQRLKYDHNGTIIFNFGKYIGKPAAETLIKDPQYYHWILEKEFSFQVKKIIKRLVEDYKKNNRS
ncbi:MAG: 3'-5' exonuclease [Saprospiraceae bacterium]|nr:3'-5' exonuclease [Saprospiraceae bacterium]